MADRATAKARQGERPAAVSLERSGAYYVTVTSQGRESAPEAPAPITTGGLRAALPPAIPALEPGYEGSA
jgi:hypothetical protein